ncbi:putative Ser/Thr protein kinase [Sphingomonas sp. UYAg733]
MPVERTLPVHASDDVGSTAAIGLRGFSRAEWKRICDVFDRLAELPGATRETQLVKLALSPTTVVQVRAMLAANDKAGMLDAPLAGERSDSPDYASLASGSIIGGFRVDRLIGRGGIGEVYLAHREDAGFEQRVALKLLRPESAGRFELFNAERRLLARLEHPGIARFIDGGIAPDGRPFMAMEYVEGQEIGAWCAEQQPTLATRLKLFLEMCDAVRYAHAQLVIHRDIKPGNILVDQSGRARLLDFGIARLIDVGGLDLTATHAFATPCYAAPEQLDGGRLTVATDIYALGAVLFELLAGRAAWAFGEGALWPTMMRRWVSEEPPSPSGVAQDAAVPSGQIAGDLDAIVAKAMRRLPADRYMSVEALAEDVHRHLTLQPVLARSGSRGYRVRRFLRRNRWTAIATAAIALALLGGIAGTTWQARRAAEERNVARADAERLESINQAMMLVFRDAADPARLEKMTARELIDGSATRLAMSLPPESPESAAVVGALADLHMIVENSAGAKTLLQGAMTRGIGVNDAPGAARLKLKLATILVGERHFAEARRLIGEANRMWRTDPTRFRRERVESVGAQAYMLRLEGKRDEGIALLMDNMPEAELAYAGYSRDLTTRYANLVTHLSEANRIAEAETVVRRGQAVLARRGEQHSQAALTLRRLEAALVGRRDPAAAATILGQVVMERRLRFGPSTGLAVDLFHYARMLNQTDRPAAALSALNDAAPMAVEYLGPDAPPTLLIELARVDALGEAGRITDADREFQRLAAGLQGEKPLSLINGVRMLTQARLVLKQGDAAAADVALRAAATIFRAIGPAAEPYAPVVRAARREIASAPVKR